MMVYPQVLVKSFECRSAACRDDIKSLNSLIYTYDDQFCKVESIVVFRQRGNLIGGMFTRNYEVDDLHQFHNVAHIVPIVNEGDLSFLSIQNVRDLAIKRKLIEEQYITCMSNQLEID